MGEFPQAMSVLLIADTGKGRLHMSFLNSSPLTQSPLGFVRLILVHVLDVRRMVRI